MGPRFEKIACTTESLEELEKLIITRLPESIHLLVLCRIAIQDRFSKKIIVQFYKYVDPTTDELREAAEKNPLLVCIERPNIHTKKGVILLTPANPTEKMVETFDTFIGWDHDQVFQGAQPPFWEHLQRLCTKHNNLNPDNSLGIPGIMLAIDNDQARLLPSHSTNDQVVIRSLEEKDVPVVVKNWKWAVEHSAAQVKETIKSLVSCGLFVKVEGEDGSVVEEDLASCVVLSPLGTFNVLYTVDKYKRRGFAKMVMEWASKQAAVELGIPPLAEVESWNDVSKTLLEKVGYREVFQTRWYFYETPCNN